MKWRFEQAALSDFDPLPDAVTQWLEGVGSDEAFTWVNSPTVIVEPCPDCGAEIGERTRAELGVQCRGCGAKLTWDRLTTSEAPKVRGDWHGAGEGLLILGAIGVGKSHLAAAREAVIDLGRHRRARRCVCADRVDP